METSQPARRNRTLLIVAAVGIVLLCTCLVLAIAGFFSFVAIRSVDTQELPAEEFPSVATQEVVTPTLDPDTSSNTPSVDPDLGEVPTGGLGNDILRNDTWQYVAAAAVGQGCDQPIGEESTIEVLQEPDASGVWVEEWTVVCQSGDSYAYEVEYILDATGATFNIRSLP
ncbi:MAG TPA: hypothetical protein VK897_24665 [Anaerolineales bacterium]|nr:hypothetical protein [Anaerolineales bacterium]